MAIPNDIIRVSDAVWEIPVTHKEGMRVPGRIVATEKLLADFDDGAIDQLTNVAMLPGIVGYAYCMPDGHWGYGFPIGGARGHGPRPWGDLPRGDRLRRQLRDAPLPHQPFLRRGPAAPARARGQTLRARPGGSGRHGVRAPVAGRVPDGRGTGGPLVREERATDGRRTWSGRRRRGASPAPMPARISEKAIDRGYKQIGTLGSGNHYLEIQVAHRENVFDAELAKAFGIVLPDQVVIMFHCGSRGFGHQVATDYLQVFLKVMDKKYGIRIVDRELACAPFRSPEGQEYFAAMKCAINMSFVNRQVILHRIREVFSDVFGKDPTDLGMHQVYDVAHNTAKLERHRVRRRGAGAARPPEGSHPGVRPRDGGTSRGLPFHGPAGDHRREHGDGVVPPGRGGGRGQHVLHDGPRERPHDEPDGRQEAMARPQAPGGHGGRGIYVRTATWAGLAEEAGPAYKDIDEVIDATELAGISRRVAKLSPVGNVKG